MQDDITQNIREKLAFAAKMGNRAQRRLAVKQLARHDAGKPLLESIPIPVDTRTRSRNRK